MKSIIILYHNDLDGFGAAWAAWKKFGNKADYFATDYTKKALKKLNNKEIYILDFGYSENELKTFLKTNKKVVMIDHHITSKKKLKLLKEYVWDIKRAGCVLSWQYFHQNKKIPKLLEYVEDMDLWKFRLKNTREITIYLESLNRNFNLWNKLAVDIENKKKFSDYLEKGRAILGFAGKLVEFLASNAEEAIFDGKKAMVVNSPIFNSEIGNYLVNKTKRPIALIWSLKNGQISVSLRSTNKIDVSKIAQKYGGGGHKKAAGFELEVGEKIPWEMIKR